MIRINLVPQEILDKELQKQRVIQIGAVVGLVVLIFAGISYGHYHRSVSLKKDLELKQAELKKLADVKRKLEAAKLRRQQVLDRRDVIKDLLASRELFPRFMTDLVKSMEGGVWLDSLTTSTPEGGKTVDVAITCSALRPRNITNYLRALDSAGAAAMSGVFSGATIGPITYLEGANKFSLSMKYTRKTE